MKRFYGKKGNVVFPCYQLTQFICYGKDAIQDLGNERETVLLDAKRKTLGTNLKIAACELNYYLVFVNPTYSLFRWDGTLVCDGISCFEIYAAHWIAVARNNGVSLYRSDATLAFEGAENFYVPDDGLTFLAKGKKGLWKLFQANGELIAENIVDFNFYSSTFFALKFADNPKTVVFDRKGKREKMVDFDCRKMKLYGGRMFSVSLNDKALLYSAGGKLLLSRYQSYHAFDNGLVLAQTFNDTKVLLNVVFDTVLLNVEQVVYDPQFSSLMLVKGKYGCFIFDAYGKLIYRAASNTLRLAGKDCFLRKNENNDKWELLRSDLKILDDDCYAADVYPNGWIVLLKRVGTEHELFRTYYVLRNDLNETVVDDALSIAYLAQSGAYLVNRNTRFFLYGAKGNCIVDDADCIYTSEYWFWVGRKNQPAEIGLLGNFVD